MLVNVSADEVLPYIGIHAALTQTAWADGLPNQGQTLAETIASYTRTHPQRENTRRGGSFLSALPFGCSHVGGVSQLRGVRRFEAGLGY